MIKIISLLTKFVIALLCSVLFASCNHTINLKSITGSGTVEKENRTVTNPFKSIEVSNAIDLVLEQSDKTEITVEADDNLISSIRTRIENGVLVIDCDYNSFLDIESKKVIVKMPLIEELKASSSSSISGTNTLKGEEIVIRASSAANIKLDLEYDRVNAKASSASTIVMYGLALDLNANSSSGSEIEADDLLSNEVIAAASSGASIKTHPIVRLKAKASSGGSIEYSKTPKSMERRVSSGGSVDKI
ncbi:DUF2807 domain-containing protein [Flavobacterium sp. F-380]|uniref:DUF2807 domain-containing protein n=1 Tax=Flavobacterium kayseriense TaxID=2764714 RepID=A0ABR7J719_9FLAO|nr:head GIN domain-containing protein [Flavobacterium kayseriense]MBC5841319.1 DUF2807 domain-containing protein [Flavobacterium kayseriense]MBC5847847.1 DUF2807 domain-containing protein [Flavobacterium kayseriense]